VARTLATEQSEARLVALLRSLRERLPVVVNDRALAKLELTP